MAELYVCPADGRGYNTAERFAEHAVVAHGHRPDEPECTCESCVVEALAELVADGEVELVGVNENGELIFRSSEED